MFYFFKFKLSILNPLLKVSARETIHFWAVQNPVLDEREHMVYVVKPSSEAANRPYLARPIGERNASFGAQAFLPLEELDKYVKDNTMFLKCNVDTEHMIML